MRTIITDSHQRATGRAGRVRRRLLHHRLPGPDRTVRSRAQPRKRRNQHQNPALIHKHPPRASSCNCCSYSHVPVMRDICDKLQQMGMRVCAVYLIDSQVPPACCQPHPYRCRRLIRSAVCCRRLEVPERGHAVPEHHDHARAAAHQRFIQDGSCHPQQAPHAQVPGLQQARPLVLPLELMCNW